MERLEHTLVSDTSRVQPALHFSVMSSPFVRTSVERTRVMREPADRPTRTTLAELHRPPWVRAQPQASGSTSDLRPPLRLPWVGTDRGLPGPRLRSGEQAWPPPPGTGQPHIQYRSGDSGTIDVHMSTASSNKAV